MNNIKSFNDFVLESEDTSEKLEVLSNKEVRSIVDKIRKAVEQKMGKADAQTVGEIIGKVMAEI